MFAPSFCLRAKVHELKIVSKSSRHFGLSQVIAFPSALFGAAGHQNV
jgi:hypothetical protein